MLGRIIEHVRDIHRVGSAALDLCSVAAGRVDAYYERGLNAWDYGAGELIAREAGATVTDLHGDAPSTHSLVAAAPVLHEQLRSLLMSACAG